MGPKVLAITLVSATFKFQHKQTPFGIDVHQKEHYILQVQVQEGKPVDSNPLHLRRGRNIDLALDALEEMGQNGILADSSDIVELMQVSKDMTVLKAGDRIYGYILKFSSSFSVSIFNKLMEMYFKLGETKRAGRVFQQMACKNLDSWNTTITSLAENGREQVAVQVFSQMVRCACEYLGDVEKGQAYLQLTSQDYSISPSLDHYVSFVNLLRKAAGGKTWFSGRSMAYEKLRSMSKKAKKADYVPDTRYNLHDDQEEKERALLYHTHLQAPLRVIKNLRICGDCHNLIKILSSFEKQEIIVRDNKRFHHFKNRKCSCKDFFVGKVS
ncbi:hypothetical protein Pfo_016939 [Paulownia fortunei]|nr:hypothetical protein Pfo_016939 [Paulownia fortunei]